MDNKNAIEGRGRGRFAFVFLNVFSLLALILLNQTALARSITLSGRITCGPNQMPVGRVKVEVWDDFAGAVAPEAATWTNANGYYSVSYDNTDPVDLEDGRIDPRLKIVCDNEAVVVWGTGSSRLQIKTLAGLSTWSFWTGVIARGLDQNRIYNVSVTSDGWQALVIHSAISDVYFRLRQVLGHAPRGQTPVIWPAAMVLLNNGNSCSSFGRIYMSFQGAAFPHEAQHEYGHVLYDTITGLDNPLNRDEDWTEGWANFISAWTRNNDLIQTSLGSSHCENGGYLATRAFWDLVDSAPSADESPGRDDDPLSEQRFSDVYFHKIWEIMEQAKPRSLQDFWNAWRQRNPGLIWEAKCCLVNNGAGFITNRRPQISSVEIATPAMNGKYAGQLRVVANLTDQDQEDREHLKTYFFAPVPRGSNNTIYWFCLGAAQVVNGQAAITWDTRSWTTPAPYDWGSSYNTPQTLAIGYQENVRIRALAWDGMPWDPDRSSTQASWVRESAAFTIQNVSPTGRLAISSTPADADVYLDNAATASGKTNCTLTVTAGTHRIRLVKTGYSPWSAEVSVGAGETKTVNATLIPGQGQIIVNSNPDQASIYLDGQPTGKTTYAVLQVSAGTHTITLKKQGYQDRSQTVTVAADQTVTVNLDLTSSQATVLVKSVPTGALVEVDGETVGFTDTTLSLSPGRHTISLSMGYYEGYSQSVDLAAGQSLTINATLRPIATLIIKSNPPGAQASMGMAGSPARDLGLTDCTVATNPGTYMVVLRKEGYEIWSGTITIARGETKTINATLIPLAAQQPQGAIPDFQGNCQMLKHGQRVNFPRPFANTPVIVVSAQLNRRALAACAVNNDKTGFILALYDLDGRPVTGGAWVQWVAVDAPAGTQVQTGLGRWKNGAGITFAQPFFQVPVVVASAQINGKPLLACAVNNAAGGFTLSLYDLDGRPVTTGAWVQYIALPPTSGKAVYGGVEVQAGICQADSGQHLGFPQTFSKLVAVVCSAQKAGVAHAAAAMNNNAGGFDAALNDPHGGTVAKAWYQWLAIGGL